MNDQDRISPYNIYTISTRYEMRIKKIIILLRINSWPNTKLSELTLYKNCEVDSKENYKFDQGVKGLKQKMTNMLPNQTWSLPYPSLPISSLALLCSQIISWVLY